ncbi:MAG: hypothetical protein M1825_005409 [Sarcosagium campestre]|nr:MAG: hypothetical protein M1825_005409 [Sarcosagium campestre]
MISMPHSKPKPAEIAAEAKRTFLPYIEQVLSHYPANSYVYGDTSAIRVPLGSGKERRLRVAVIDGDPIDVALDWYEANVKSSAPMPPPNSTRQAEVTQIPVVNMANEKRPGGDWESGLMAPEESFCRRSNLFRALTTPIETHSGTSNHPIPQKGAIYSPHVVVFRSGPEHYQVWAEFKPLPVISVAPVRRPKLDESGLRYSFDQERELMKEKVRSILRVAARHSHKDLCVGAFGAGTAFRNPVGEVARMWKDILFSEEEFDGVFANVVFAIETNPGGSPRGSLTDYEVFKQEFDPSNIFRTPYT